VGGRRRPGGARPSVSLRQQLRGQLVTAGGRCGIKTLCVAGNRRTVGVGCASCLAGVFSIGVTGDEWRPRQKRGGQSQARVFSFCSSGQTNGWIIQTNGCRRGGRLGETACPLTVSAFCTFAAGGQWDAVNSAWDGDYHLPTHFYSGRSGPLLGEMIFCLAHHTGKRIKLLRYANTLPPPLFPVVPLAGCSVG